MQATRVQGLCPACTWQSLTTAEKDEEEPVPGPGLSEGLFRLAGHIVIEEIARGGMGIVYRARQMEPSREVALKMLLPHQLGSAEMRERFRLEVRAIAALEHPAILPVYQVGDHEGTPFFTMKLAAGGTLASRTGRFRGNFRETARLMVTLAEAVHFAHERGVLHRDLKPGNILFDAAGRPYVSDFGLAKFTEFASDSTTLPLTRSIRLLGTPQFLSPEVVAGSVGAATTSADIYSLGAILYELLTGEPPFVSGNLTTLLKEIAERDPAPPSKRAGVPRDLEVICLKCLAKETTGRYTSARELGEDLRRWLDGRPILARPVLPVQRVWLWARNHQALAILSLLLAVSLLAGTTLLIRANYRLQHALKENLAANAAAQRNLYASLLVEARLLRNTGDFAQRSNLLTILKQAAQIKPSQELRNEAVAALALPASGALTFPGAPPVFVQFGEARDQSQSCTLDVSRDGRLLVTGTLEGVHLWNTDTRKELWSRTQAAVPWMYVAFPPDGESVLYSSRNFGILRSQVKLRASSSEPLDVEVGEPQTIGRPIDTTIMGFTKKGTDWIVAADRSGFYISRVEVWPDGNPDQPKLVAAGQKITWLALSPDERWAASTTVPAYDVRIWDTTTSKSFLLSGAANAMVSAFSPDGRFLIARMPKDYGLWETATWKQIRQWHVGFGGRATSGIIFSRDGLMVASPLGGNGFQLLDARSFSELCILAPPVAFEASSAVWSPDDHKVYILDGSHRVFEWNIALLKDQLVELGLGW